jgi:hypothetical protein
MRKRRKRRTSSAPRATGLDNRRERKKRSGRPEKKMRVGMPSTRKTSTLKAQGKQTKTQTGKKK